jgi:hypothetical protein
MFGLDSEASIAVVLGMLVAWVLPLVITVWALVTLARIRADQREVLTRLSMIERRLLG